LCLTGCKKNSWSTFGSSMATMQDLLQIDKAGSKLLVLLLVHLDGVPGE
jgi:hypothetical protein